MTLSEFVEHLYGVATGWLGWSPEVAWTTPMPEIYVAMKARVKWEQMRNGVDTDPQETLKQRLRGWGR